jgi:transcriptional regulator with XRE-family HTH domain
MLGQRLKELREARGFVQREVAAKLEIDTAYVSKMEKGDKQISRGWIPVLSKMLEVSESELLTLWLADKIEKQITGENLATLALELVLTRLKNTKN